MPEQPQAEKPVTEKQTNCIACKKPLKRLMRYYRAGKYYCSKKCWKKSKKDKSAPEK